MKDKRKKLLMLVLGILGLVGGAVHVLQPLGFNLLTVFNDFWGYSKWVQFVAGVATLIFIGMKIKK